ncbi:MAG: hypothetical protein FJ338_03625 [Sphingomonadales bacterium]|nr:hypothetical protein [Sphingomonadales bacterium]
MVGRLIRCIGLVGLLSLASWGKVMAQEGIYPIRLNPILRDHHAPSAASLHARTQRSTDTLALPFVDDFSHSGYFPDPHLWADRHVFRNNDMAIRPPGQGFVTFDGLDSTGRPYDNSSLSASGRADFLTSRPLRLGGYSAVDSLFLTFAYQPAGWSESPEPTDSLILEFQSSSGSWNKVWHANGSSVQPFRFAVIGLSDPQYLYDGMRMRWVNYGSLTGLVDCWHLDYVFLDAGRTSSDTLFDDIALVQTNATYLRPYRSMPLNQFMEDTSRFLNPTHGVSVVNNGNSVTYDRSYRVFAQNASVPLINSSPLPSLALGTLSSSGLIFQRFAVPTSSADSLTLRIEYVVQTPSDYLPRNDTLNEGVKLWNEFAYDDGTAETGYGINVVAGSCANKFWLSKPDTLRGVWMYFTQAAANASNELFVLKVWSQIQEGGRAATEIFRSPIPYRPRYGDSIGQFQYFAINPPLLVQDSFYIGWQQETPGLINIGLDRNDTLVRYNRWYNTQGIWEESSIAGSWMIRPVMGGPFRYPATIRSDENALPTQWSVVPNPVQASNPVFNLRGTGQLRFAQLWNSAGVLMGQVSYEAAQESERSYAFVIPSMALTPGIYLLLLKDINGALHRCKILLQ